MGFSGWEMSGRVVMRTSRTPWSRRTRIAMRAVAPVAIYMRRLRVGGTPRCPRLLWVVGFVAKLEFVVPGGE
jgi:hypothetical protein